MFQIYFSQISSKILLLAWTTFSEHEVQFRLFSLTCETLFVMILSNLSRSVPTIPKYSLSLAVWRSSWCCLHLKLVIRSFFYVILRCFLNLAFSLNGFPCSLSPTSNHFLKFHWNILIFPSGSWLYLIGVQYSFHQNQDPVTVWLASINGL